MTDAITCEAVTKRYGTNTVVSDVDLAIREGTVHSLVGANGAGKSTLLGMMSGRVAPSHGVVSVFGQALRTGQPAEARRSGLTAVYQELTVLPALTALENVFLGQEIGPGGWLSKSAMRSRYQELCAELDLHVSADAPARSLSVATAQMLEIMRAIQANARIILFDEPTAALSQHERRQFLDLVQRLKARGITMVLVTHNLGEVLEASDEITVMTGGAKVATGPVSDWDRAALVRAMTGEELAARPPQRGTQIGDIVLEARDVTLPGAIEGVNISVRRGEVVGLAGLVGSGRSSLLRSLGGAEPASSGELILRGTPSRWMSNVRKAMRQGIGLIPEERKTEGLLLKMGIPDNVTLTKLAKLSRGGLISRRRQLEVASRLLAQLSISRPVGDYPVGWLSGGNQQKVAVAKWLYQDPDILLVDEPTRGIDVSAKVDVLDAIRTAADRGKAVVMTSSEIEEVLEISDRVIVMSEGRAVAEVDLHAENPTVPDILQLAFRMKGIVP